MSEKINQYFQELSDLRVPTKRAAYSDRTAWLMSILSEIAYTQFDEETDDEILEIAKSLIAITNDQEDATEAVKNKLKAFSKKLAFIGQGKSTDDNNNKILKDLLELGGFKLAGGSPIYEKSTDTQAYVVVRKGENGAGFAVVCFRGTQQLKDWLTNLNIDTVPIYGSTGGEIGVMHEGFHTAYKSVEDRIYAQLKGLNGMPIYFTGHSLGGALAVVATWYHDKHKLAACYTFGAPRVGDSRLAGRFRTPIYRVVNGIDPVPFVPQSEFISNVFDFVKRTVGLFGLIERIFRCEITLQGFTHFGYTKYIEMVKAKDGVYRGIRVLNNVTPLSRLSYFLTKLPFEHVHLFKYHDITEYRNKLRAIALIRNS